jgi:Na+-translocating ferredoxin:NAD+ oxidoreductase RnfG subunit
MKSGLLLVALICMSAGLILSAVNNMSEADIIDRQQAQMRRLMDADAKLKQADDNLASACLNRLQQGNK